MFHQGQGCRAGYSSSTVISLPNHHYLLACRDIIAQATKKNVAVRGPAYMPTKVLRITTRKTPCGEGSKTWDRFEMRIHKRVVDFTCSLNVMREITAIKIESGVDVEVTVAGL